MSVSFSLAKHLAKPGDKTSDSKYYACTQINDSISLKMFAGLIEKQTTVSRADCTAVLVSAVDNLVTELQRWQPGGVWRAGQVPTPAYKYRSR